MNTERTQLINRIDRLITSNQNAEAIQLIDSELRKGLVPKDQAIFFCAAARSEEQQRRFTSARALYQKAQDTYPASESATPGIIRTYLEEGNVEAALESFETAKQKSESEENQRVKTWGRVGSAPQTQIEPNLPNWRILQGQAAKLLLTYGYTQEAKSLLQDAQAKFPNYEQNAIRLAAILESEGELKQAHQTLEKILTDGKSKKAKTSTIEPYLRISDKLGKTAEAEIFLQKIQIPETQLILAETLRRNNPIDQKWEKAAHAAIKLAKGDVPLAQQALMLLVTDPRTSDQTKTDAISQLLDLNSSDVTTLLFVTKRLPDSDSKKALEYRIQQNQANLEGEDQALIIRAQAERESQENQPKKALATIVKALAILTPGTTLQSQTQWRAAQYAIAAGEKTQASEFFTKIIGEEKTPVRFRIQALLEYTKLHENPSAEVITNVETHLRNLANTIEDPQTLLDVSRQILATNPKLEPLAKKIYKLGVQKAEQDILQEESPATILAKTFLLARRQTDFRDDESIILFWEKTLESKQAALQREPNFSDYAYYLAQSYWLYGSENEAKKLIEASLQDPRATTLTKAALLNLRGYYTLNRENNVSKSMSDFQKVIQEAPTSAHASRSYYWLCLQKLDAKEYQPAQELARNLTQTLEIDRSNQFIWQKTLRDRAPILLDLANGKTPKASEEFDAIKTDMRQFQAGNSLKSKTQSAFTLIETLVTLLVIGLILTFAVPSLLDARRNSVNTGSEAAVKTLNEAAVRAKLKGLVGPGTVGNDKVAAYDWYEQLNLLGNIKPLNLDPLYYAMSVWGSSTLQDDPGLWAGKIANGEYSPSELQEIIARLGEAGPDALNALINSNTLTPNLVNTLSGILNNGANGKAPLQPGQSPTSSIEGLIALSNNPNLPPGSEIDWKDLPLNLLDKRDLAGIDFENQDMSGSNLDSRWLDNLSLQGINLENANLHGASFNNGSLENANLKNTNLSYADLRGTNLTGADLTGANLDHAKLSGSGGILTNAQIESAETLTGTRFGSNLDISGINLEERDLRGTTFLGAMQGANLSNANLDGARIEGNIEGIDLTGAQINNLLLGRDGDEQEVIYMDNTAASFSQRKAEFQLALGRVVIGVTGRPSRWIDGTPF